MKWWEVVFVTFATLGIALPILTPRLHEKTATTLASLLWEPFYLGWSPIAWPLIGVLFSAMLSSAGRISWYPRVRRGEGILALMTWVGLAATLARSTPFEFSIMKLTIPLIALAAVVLKRYSMGGMFLAGILVLGLPLSFVMGPYWWPVPVGIIAGLIIVGQRSALLSSLVTFLWAVWVNPWNLAIIAGGVFIGLAWFTTNTVPVFQRTTTEQLEEGLGDRLRMWGWACRRILRRPLIGYGMNTFLLGHVDHRANKEVLETPHNEYLNVAYCNGLIGVAAMAWVLGTVFWGHPLDAAHITILSYSVWLLFGWNALAIGGLAWAMLGMAVVK